MGYVCTVHKDICAYLPMWPAVSSYARQKVPQEQQQESKLVPYQLGNSASIAASTTIITSTAGYRYDDGDRGSSSSGQHSSSAAVAETRRDDVRYDYYPQQHQQHTSYMERATDSLR